MLPFLDWIDELTIENVRHDFISGLTVALVLVPQSMAYAQLAGLPAYYGLYAAFLPPMIANLFGSSRQLATGPVAVVSLMTAASLEPLATAGSDQFIAYAILLAMLVGIFQLILGVAKLGLVVNFLSHPVVNGFTNAAALIIASSQLDKIFGVSVEKAEHHYQTVARVLAAAAHWTHLPTFLMAVVAFGVMVGLRRLNPRLPNVLVAVVVTSVLAWGFRFERNETVSEAEIASPRLPGLIAEFNSALTTEHRMEEYRGKGRQVVATVAGSSAEFCQRCHPARQVASFMEGTASAEDEGVRERGLALHQMAGLLDSHIEELKERAAHARTEVRSIALYRVLEDDPRAGFYERELVPDGAPVDGRRWRIKIGNHPLNEDELTLVGGGAVVGEIPRGLPSPEMPQLDFRVIPKLLVPAIIISLLGFMEAISIAKAMAAKTRQRLDPNQELIGQGLANMVGCVFQSYAVSGSFSRSAVNLQAGAKTGMSNVFSSGVVMIVLLFLSPLLYYLPQAVLAAIIMLAVIGLLNVSGFVHAWRTSPFDGFVSIVTFGGTLMFAPHLEWGIFMGVALSLGGYLYRSMRPHVARLAPAVDGTVRDAVRHQLGTCRYVALVGFDGPLNFASTSYLEDEILIRVAEQPDLRYLVLSGQGITEIDATGEETLRHLVDRLRGAHIQVAFTDLSDKVLDVLRRSHLLDKIGEDLVFATDVRAIAAIYAPAHRDADEADCPFLGVVPRLTELSLHPDGSLRDAVRHRLPLCRYVAALRIDSPINRASVRYVEEWVLERVAARPDLRHVLFAATGMADLDAEGAHRLSALVVELRQRGLGVSFSGVSDRVLDVLERTAEIDAIGRVNLLPTQVEAVASIWPAAHLGTEEAACPLRPLAPHLTELALHPNGTLRDAARHQLPLCDHVAVLRFDGALLFASGSALITEFSRWAEGRNTVEGVVLMGTTLSRMDETRAAHLREFVNHVRDRGLQVVLCHVADGVMDVLRSTGAAAEIGEEIIFPGESQALAEVLRGTHRESGEADCPLLKAFADS